MHTVSYVTTSPLLYTLIRMAHAPNNGQCAALAQLVSGSYFGALITLPLALDVAGTFQTLFVVTRQFESAVLSTGRDITVLLVVRISCACASCYGMWEHVQCAVSN